MKKEISFKIENNEITYLGDVVKLIKELKLDNEGKQGLATFEISDDVKFWQHKYYRGELLEFFALNMGITKDEAHQFFKEKFLKCDLMEYEEIPSKYRARAKEVIKVALDNTTGEQTLLSRYYIPSMGDLNYKDAADYIRQCELFAVEWYQYSVKDNQARENARL